MEHEKSKPTNLFDNKERYLAFRKQWSKLAEAKQLTAVMMLFYNLARGVEYMRGFTPITNEVKLANGAKADQALTATLDDIDDICFPTDKGHEVSREAFIKIFGDVIDDEFITKVANYMGANL